MSIKRNTPQDWLALAKSANWSVMSLAKLCDVSIRTLERHFVKTMGKTPKAWLNDQRQKQAIELLRDGSSAKETAATLGYRHASTFAREFKKHNGLCPHDLVNCPL